MAHQFINILVSLPRFIKTIIQVITDIVIVVFCFWLAMALRLEGIMTTVELRSWLALIAVIPVTIFTLERLGFYRSVVRYMTDRMILTLMIGSAISSAVMFLLNGFYELQIPRSVPAIYFSIFTLITGGTRLTIRALFLLSKEASRNKVAIYGAGEAGHLLLQSLSYSKNYQAYIFIDDDPKLHGRKIGGVPVLSFERARVVIDKNNVRTALIAIGDKNKEVQFKIYEKMVSLGLEVRVIPKLADLISEKVKISNLRRLHIDDLLGRDVIDPDLTLTRLTISEKSVLVSGAGGSIGSELCRQIIEHKPTRLVLLDSSEYALYKILDELNVRKSVLENKVELIAVLGSVTHRKCLERAIIENKVDTFIHAAAYKHVPLCEDNAAEAVRNNIVGTQLAAELAGELGVLHFTLISSDKAVRPTNIMGATKRLAELIVHSMSRSFPGTSYCAVRFGNVLGSSGSVVPKFNEQISKGGPITVTHKDIERYFMTASEAAQLVLQASALAESGRTYLLDMGKPIRIVDLARTMCSLHGRKAYIDGVEEVVIGGIKIELTGLRPGEKLFEELLVSGNETPTIHPKIMCDNSNQSKIYNIEQDVNYLTALTNNSDIAQALQALPLEYTMDRLHHARDTAC